MEGANNGVVAGHPVVDVIVRIIDGSFHEVDSSELAFKMAGIFAFKDAMKKADPILLEPIMGVEVTTPEEYQGDLIGDINRRRGHIHGIENKAGACIIAATCRSRPSSATSPTSAPSPRAAPAPRWRPRISSRSRTRSCQKIVETTTKAPART